MEEKNIRGLIFCGEICAKILDRGKDSDIVIVYHLIQPNIECWEKIKRSL
jgi:hypothetical protein